MIYILLANGASVIPLFFPGIPQSLLLLWVFSVLRHLRLRTWLFVYVFIFFFIAMIAISLPASEPGGGGHFLKLLINVIVSLLIAVDLERRYTGRFSEVYSRAILTMTAVGILGLLLVTVSTWNISASSGDRSYHTNLLTTWLLDNGANSSRTLFSPLPYRLQAMFDEPGTFGMLLIPAFFHFLYKGKVGATALLLLGAFLSESANALLLCALLLFIKVWTVRSLLVKSLFAASLCAGLAVVWPALVLLYEVKTGIDAAYTNLSSLGVRSAEFAYLREAWMLHFWPLQNKQAFLLFPSGISVSYIRWYMIGGVLFAFVLLSVLMTLVSKALRNWRCPSADYNFSLALAATLLLSGLQRSSFLDSILFMSLTFWALIHRPRPQLLEVRA